MSGNRVCLQLELELVSVRRVAADASPFSDADFEKVWGRLDQSNNSITDEWRSGMAKMLCTMGHLTSHQAATILSSFHHPGRMRVRFSQQFPHQSDGI